MTAARRPDSADAPGVALSAEGLIALRQVALRVWAQPVLADLPGGFALRRKGQGQEVADVRPYVTGDDLRHLDRGTTARTGELHVRQFMDERDRVTLLVADFRAPMLWGVTRAFRSVAAAEALTLLGWQSVEEGGRVGLLAITAQGQLAVRPRGRVRGMLDVIGGMVQAHAQALGAAYGQGSNAAGITDMELAPALERADRLVPRGAEVLVASGFDDVGPLEDRLADLARRRQIHLLRVSDAEAGGLPRGRYPIRLADGRRLRVSLSGQAGHDRAVDEVTQIAGHPALRLDAGWPVDQLARRLAARFPAAQIMGKRP